MSQIRQPTQPNPGTPDSEYESAAQQFYALMQQAVRYSIPAYDYWEPLIMGGQTGTYQMLCPFDTTCEYRILYMAAADAATCYIGKIPGFPAPGNSTTIGGVAGSGTPTPDRGMAGVVLSAGANATAPGPDEWLPYAPQDVLTIQLTVASSHAAWVGILFRRRRQASGVYLEGA